MSFKEISVLDINKYKDSISLFKDWAITVVEDNEKVNPMKNRLKAWTFHERGEIIFI